MTKLDFYALLKQTSAKEHAREISAFFESRGVVDERTLQNAPRLGHLWGHDIFALVHELNMLISGDLDGILLGDPVEDEEE